MLPGVTLSSGLVTGKYDYICLLANTSMNYLSNKVCIVCILSFLCVCVSDRKR